MGFRNQNETSVHHFAIPSSFLHIRPASLAWTVKLKFFYQKPVQRCQVLMSVENTFLKFGLNLLGFYGLGITTLRLNGCAERRTSAEDLMLGLSHALVAQLV